MVFQSKQFLIHHWSGKVVSDHMVQVAVSMQNVVLKKSQTFFLIQVRVGLKTLLRKKLCKVFVQSYFYCKQVTSIANELLLLQMSCFYCK